MTWTREPPTVSGFWWLRGRPEKGPPIIVRVVRSEPYLPLEVFLAGSDYPNAPDELGPDSEWYGPIEPPA